MLYLDFLGILSCVLRAKSLPWEGTHMVYIWQAIESTGISSSHFVWLCQLLGKFVIKNPSLHEKMLNITHYQRNANQNHNEVPSHAGQNGCYQKSTNDKCWRGCREKGTLLHCWWECKLVQPLWRTEWRFL